MKLFILFACLLFIHVRPFRITPSLTEQRIQYFDNSQPRVILSAATGTAHLVTVENRLDTKRSAGSSAEALMTFLEAHPEIGITDPKKQLIEVGRQSDPHIKQWTITNYQQLYEGLVVESALLKVTFNEDNTVVTSSSTIVPDLHMSIVPTITEQQAIEIARSALTNSMQFDAGHGELKIYRTDLARGIAGTNHLAYHVVLSCIEHYRKHFAYVDAHSGVVLNAYNPVHNALSRQVNQYTTSQRLYSEGDATPVNAEVKMLTDTVYQQYNIMKNVAGWHSWDLNDGTFIMEVNVTASSMDDWSCPNAMFYIDRSYYCPGMGYGADVAGHEWGHGYSDVVVGSGGFVYQYQSGALSESFADIIGETVQLLWKQPQSYAPRADRSCTIPNNNRRWIIGDQITSVVPVLNSDGKLYGFRDMYNPNCYGDPASTDDQKVWCNAADGGGVHANSGIPNQAYALFADGGVINSTTFSGVGLVKAFHVYMRGLTKHVPSTTFGQHADFVMVACNELASNSVNLTDPLTGQPSGLIVNTADCSTLANVFSATKMRSSSFCGASEMSTPGQVLRGPFPPVVLPIGKDSVYWETSNFFPYQSVQCRIGNGTPFSGSVYQTQWSEFSYCSVPALNGEQSIQLYISYNGTDWFGPYNVAVKGVYNVNSYSPSSGSLDGGTTITVEGNDFFEGFAGCNPTTSAVSDPDCSVCFFSSGSVSAATPATVVSSTQVKCTTPSWQSLGASDKMISFSISMNYFLALGPFDYTYTAISTPAAIVNVTKTPINFDQHIPASTMPVPPTDTGAVPNSAIHSPQTKQISSASLTIFKLWLFSFMCFF